MKRSGIIGLCCWLFVNSLTAQPLTITRLVVVPKRTTLAKPVVVELKDRQPRIKLTYEQNDFIIYFQSVGLAPPYAYRLKDGYVNYSMRTANSYAFFTNIPSGNYTFTVWATARPDLPPAQLSLRIESPLWLQWWFLPMLFLYGIVLVGIIFYFIYRYRLRQMLHIHSVRENIARDLHDDMGSYLSSISIMSQSIENLAHTEPQKAYALVQKIGTTARQVMDSMGDIIWSVKPDNDSTAQIVVRMRNLGADLLEGQDIVFDLTVSETIQQAHLPLEQRRDFFLIYKEALTNIAKHAQASHVWIQLVYKEHSLQLKVEDDGLGFDLAQPSQHNVLGGNGLRNMLARAEKIGAILTINANHGQGTSLTLQIPLP